MKTSKMAFAVNLNSASIPHGQDKPCVWPPGDMTKICLLMECVVRDLWLEYVGFYS